MRDKDLIIGTKLDIGTTAGADAAKGDIIDQGALTDHAGTAIAQAIRDGNLFLNIVVNTTTKANGFKGDNTGTVKITLWGDSDATVIGGTQLLQVVVPFTTTALASGTVLFCGAIPKHVILNGSTSLRYLGISADIDTANLVDDYNEIDAWLSFGPGVTLT